MHCQCFEIILVYLRFFEIFEKLENFQEYVPQIRFHRPVTIRHNPFDSILMYTGRQVWYLPFTIVAQAKIALRAETNATDAAAAVDASDPRSSEGVQNFPSFSSLNTTNLDMPLVNQHLHWHHDKNQCWLVSVFGQYSFWVQLSGTPDHQFR